MSNSKQSKSGNDCFYYFYMKCNKGNTCSYRHCSAAKPSNQTCDDWRNNDCKARSCPNRHMESLDAQFKILCKFEMNRNTGCSKDNCDFLHRNPYKIPITRKALKTINDLKSKVKRLENALNEATISGQTNSSNNSTDNDSDHQNSDVHDLADNHTVKRVVDVKTYICCVCDANSRIQSFRKFLLLDDCHHLVCSTCYRISNRRCQRCKKHRNFTPVN